MSTTVPPGRRTGGSGLTALWFGFWVASAGMAGIVVQLIVRAVS